MEKDRGAVLTVRAAARGALDFSGADVRDVRWWRRSNIVIDALREEENREIIRAAFAFETAFLGNPNLKDNGFVESQDRARELFEDLVQAIRPWQDRDGKSAFDRQLESLMADYVATFGDPSDPEFKARMEAGAREMFRIQAAEAAAETEEQRVTRLRDERDERQRRLAAAARAKR